MAGKDTDLVPRGGTATLTERRRPGRIDYQNPHLIELLRKPGEAPLPVELAEAPALDDADADPLAPARGIFLGVLAGGSLWIAGGILAWLLL